MVLPLITAPYYARVLGVDGTGIYSCTHHLLRNCIEAVKQNKYSEEVKDNFLELVNRKKNCILGCTELPILYEKYKYEVTCGIYDPLYLSLLKAREEFLKWES